MTAKIINLFRPFEKVAAEEGYVPATAVYPREELMQLFKGAGMDFGEIINFAKRRMTVQMRKAIDEISAAQAKIKEAEAHLLQVEREQSVAMLGPSRALNEGLEFEGAMRSLGFMDMEEALLDQKENTEERTFDPDSELSDVG